MGVTVAHSDAVFLVGSIVCTPHESYRGGRVVAVPISPLLYSEVVSYGKNKHTKLLDERKLPNDDTFFLFSFLSYLQKYFF